MTGALTGIRIIDLTDHRGALAGRLLADLGAEVLRVGRKGGAANGCLPPFDSKGESLFDRCYGLGKIHYELDHGEGPAPAQLLDLVRRADVVIESFDTGEAARRGLDEAVLRQLNPSLIYMSISAFGREGPKADWPATSLTIEAAGGRIAIQGDPDRAPLPVGYPQAWHHAGAQAAADIIIALNERATSGLGQFLDLSAQEAMWWTLMGVQGGPVCSGENPAGTGEDRAIRQPGPGPRTVAARDGLVTIAPAASPPGTKTMYTFAIEEAQQLGTLPAGLDGYDWDNWAVLFRAGELPGPVLEKATTILNAYIARRTKLELVQWAMENNLRLGPLHTTRDLITFPQYLERGFFEVVDGTLQPARWVHMSGTPLSVKAPRTVEHAPDWPIKAAPDQARTSPRSGNAFEGLKVADFSWVAAGPTIGKALADHGATVVKIESGTRPDLSRTLAPHIDNQPGLNRSYWSFLYGTSKLSLQCNLATPAGKQLARQMCDWADVVIESFSPGTMARMGLDYPSLSKDHPGLIMLSTSMLGQTGPFSRYAGFGQQAAGFCGFHYITGWPDREPCGVASPYTDVVAPKFGIAALAAAILERRHSGKGQYIDLAQAECSMLFLAPLILDEVVNGRTAERQGFDSLYACPQGVYAAAGTQRYICIAIEQESQWQALCGLIPEFPFSSGFDAFARRWEKRREINAAIDLWTRGQDPFVLEQRLVATGIPASVVQRPMDVYVDPQIAARGLKQILPHTECGDVVHYGFCTRFSAKPQMIRSAPACLGEHNGFVLRELLGLPEEKVQALAAGGALE